MALTFLNRSNSILEGKHNGWLREEVFVRGDDFFNSLEENIRAAQKTVLIESYIFDYDELGKRFVQLLSETARRGVEVRLVLDGIGTWGSLKFFHLELLSAGVKVGVYNQVSFLSLLRAALISSKTGTFKRLFQWSNRRNHHKLCIIDGKTAWLGSMNITAKHLEIPGKAPAWRDTGVAIEGPEVAILMRDFERTWESTMTGFDASRKVKRWYESRLTPENSLVKVNSTGYLRRKNYLQLLATLNKAEKRIWITNAYFVPPGGLVRALRDAARRGVEVKVILPRDTDIFFMPWVSERYCYRLQATGIRIYQYQASILHAKTMVIDDIAIVGSTNLNHRSLLHDLEVDVILSSTQAVGTMVKAFEDDLVQSREFAIEEWMQSPLYRRIGGTLALYFRYWL